MTRDKTSLLTNLIELFEKDLIKIEAKSKLRKINYEFQAKINADIKDIKSSRKKLRRSDKTSNLYKIIKENYKQLLHNSLTKTYKKANSIITKTINERGKEIRKTALAEFKSTTKKNV